MTRLLMAFLTAEGSGRSLAHRGSSPLPMLLRLILLGFVSLMWLRAFVVLFQ
jgi:hypothetical protein